jgi:hypothetical protein
VNRWKQLTLRVLLRQQISRVQPSCRFHNLFWQIRKLLLVKFALFSTALANLVSKTAYLPILPSLLFSDAD